MDLKTMGLAGHMPGKTLSMDHMLVVTNSQHWSKNVYTQGKALITTRYNKPVRNGSRLYRTASNRDKSSQMRFS